MAIGLGVVKQFRMKRQSALGTIAGTSDGFVLRRKTAELNLEKETYNTADEIASHQQMISSRHGVRQVTGSLATLLSAGTYSDLMSALLRKAFASGATTGAVAVITAAATAPQFVRSTGSFLTNGFKVGDVIRWTGWATTGATNNSRNFLITALTATDMTGIFLDGTTPGAKAEGDTVTGAVQGKKCWVPATGQTNIYYTAEEWRSDVSLSYVSTDVKVAQADISFPGSGNIEATFNLVGLNQTKATSVYFTAPTAESTANVLASASGVLLIGGTQYAIVTDASLTINGNEEVASGVVGSNVRPDIFRGKVMVTGSMTLYLQDGTVGDLFINETETTLVLVNTDSTSATAEFISFVLPRIKVNSSSRDDGETGNVISVDFEGLYNSTGGTGTSSEQTTIVVQDSLAA